jgi:hypothetical protein
MIVGGQHCPRMKRISALQFLLLSFSFQTALAIQTPIGLISRTGDQSIVLHWDKVTDATLGGYRVYRSTSGATGPFSLATPALLTSPGYCDLSASAVNGNTNYYYVTAVTTSSQESAPSAPLAATPHGFASDDEFLDYVQATCFDYFWYLANPVNGLVPDRSSTGSACSIAAVGFGLTAIGIAIDHGWISRQQGAARVLTTLNTFLNGPQGPASTGVIGYKGWFYHFLDMNTALRAGNNELSSIDTALLLGGVLYANQYFDGPNATETSIRAAADAIFNRVDWTFMSQGTDAVAMGWQPGTGFSGFANWIGYNEGMIIYCLGLGTATNPLPTSAWSRWTSGYTWLTNYGQAYTPFPPLFVYQYSHCWIDFRHVADSYMNSHNSTYFENSRRASLAQVAYAVANPGHFAGYSSNVWGLTASDGPGGYNVHGIPPNGSDDGTIAPTAAGGSMPFTPEYSLPTLRYFYSHYRPRIWTAYSFRDAFNLSQGWYDTDELGIDQGPIVIMIENYRTQRVWRLFMRNAEVQRGFQRAGFVPLSFMDPGIRADTNTVTLAWAATAGRTYQVEYSPDLDTWFNSPSGEVTAAGPSATWTDNGPPGTSTPPFAAAQRFYRVFQYGAP